MKSINCNAAQYELKSILKRDQENLLVFYQELEALQCLQHKAGITKLMDVIEDEVSISMILQRKGDFTLGSILDQNLTYSREDRVEFARTVMM